MHSLLFLLIITFFLFIHVPSSVSEADKRYTGCSRFFNCGMLNGVGYPFWRNGQPRYCGHPALKLDCEDDQAIIQIHSEEYRVMEISPDNQFLKIVRKDLLGNSCSRQFVNTTLDFTPFQYTPLDEIVTLFYSCSSSVVLRSFKQFTCAVNGRDPLVGYFALSEFPSTKELRLICNISVNVPVLRSAIPDLFLYSSTSVIEVLSKGFELQVMVEWDQCSECIRSGGMCGYNSTESNCFCHDQPHTRSCRTPPAVTSPAPASSLMPTVKTPSPGNKTLKRKLIIGFCTAAGTFILTCLGFLMYRHRKKRLHATSALISQEISSDPSSKLDIEKGSKYFGIRIFTYTELEEATNNFDSSKELGDGGFGTVYYGKLRDGRAVAVKRLYENNYKRVEQFMNEIEILAGIRHQNLVTLYGCTSRHSRELLLVYEFIPNGTVADHLHGDRAQPGSLTLSTRMSIAIETAGALSYLHASEIVHRDVKTNNILLDNNFRVKVADFGLSRLFPTDVTHVSTAPQGTPGYVDPEYHQCYQLTSKSDVYSFGVVLIELISSMPAVDISRHRYEINLASMAINKIQNGALHELVDPCLGFETDKEAKRMITSVAELAFQCVQHEREARPSMDDVLESLQAIQRNEYKVEKKTQEVNIQRDDVVLLKNIQQPPSPDSVTDKWVSRSTTPNASS